VPKKRKTPTKRETKPVDAARELQAQGQDEAAYAILAPMVRALPNERLYENFNALDDIAPRVLGDVLAAMGRPREAIEAYDLHASKKSLDAERSEHQVLRLLLDELDDPSAAIVRVTRSLAARPSGNVPAPELKTFLVLAYLKCGDRARAAAALADAVADHEAFSARTREREEKYGRDGEPWQDARRKAFLGCRRTLERFAERHGFVEETKSLMGAHPSLAIPK
jgi:hypothetical protein